MAAAIVSVSGFLWPVTYTCGIEVLLSRRRRAGRCSYSLLNGAISGTKVLSCPPKLTTTFPSAASTTCPTPNLACLTLSPALYETPEDACRKPPDRCPNDAIPQPPRPAADPMGTGPDLNSSGTSEGKRGGPSDRAARQRA